MTTSKLLGLGVLVCGLAAVGCGKPADTSKASDKKADPTPAAKKEDDDHDHGPHGGAVVELGSGKNHFHGEFLVDHDKKQATVYILGEKLSDPKPVAAGKVVVSIKNPAFQADLTPSPLESDPKGQSSRFVGTHEHFGKVQEFEGTLTVEIDGKPHTGDFKEEEHKDHKHDKK